MQKKLIVIASLAFALVLVLVPGVQAVSGEVDGEMTSVGGQGMNMWLVGYNDLQGRSSYHPTIVKQGTRYILYASHHTGQHLNPLTDQMEYNGTSILDVTDPQRPKYLKHLPSLYGPPNHEARHVRVCAGDDLPGKLYPGKFFMLRSDGQYSHTIWDVTNPSNPIYISTPVDGLTYTHKESWDCQSGLAAMPSSSTTWRTNITKIFDLKDPYQPVFIRDWGLVGQEPGSTGSTPPSVHMHIIYTDPTYGTRMYAGYGTSNGACQVVDVAKMIDPAHLAPTAENILYAQIGYLKLSDEYGCHSFFPVLQMPMPDFASNRLGKVQDFALGATEATSNGCQSGYRAMAWVMDLNFPRNMQVVSSFFVPGITKHTDFCSQDGRFGAHSVSESYLPPFYKRFNAVAHFSGGVHIMDYRNPFDLKDIAWFVPDTNQNTIQNCATRDGVRTCSQVIQTNNAETDDRGYVYIVDRAGTGTHILELTGYAKQELFKDMGAPR